jgi:hypothetical protein
MTGLEPRAQYSFSVQSPRATTHAGPTAWERRPDSVGTQVRLRGNWERRSDYVGTQVRLRTNKMAIEIPLARGLGERLVAVGGGAEIQIKC